MLSEQSKNKMMEAEQVQSPPEPSGLPPLPPPPAPPVPGPDRGFALEIMGLYEPKSCCICFDTKTGSLILASLSLIVHILSILCVVSGHLAVFLDVRLEHFVQKYQLDAHDRNSIVLHVCISVLAYHSFHGVCSSLLMHGIRKDRPGLMMPYLVFQRFSIIILIITILLGIGLAELDLNRFIYHTLALIMAATIAIYFHLVINAYHKQVKHAVSEGNVYSKFNNDGNDYKGKICGPNSIYAISD